LKRVLTLALLCACGDRIANPIVRGSHRCAALGAVDTWEEITPLGADLTKNGITHVAANAGTLYVGTDGSGLFRSTDCGARWTKLNTGRNGAVLEAGPNWILAVDPLDAEVVYSASSNGADPALFKSTNGGLDWDSLSPGDGPIAQAVQFDFFEGLSIDPLDPAHLLVTFHAFCKDPTKTDPARPYDSMCVAESSDRGANWRVLKVTLPGIAPLSEGAEPWILGAGTWALTTWQNGVFLSQNSGASWSKVAEGSHDSRYRTTPGGESYTGSPYGMNRVSADGLTWTLVPGSPNGFGVIGDGKRLFTSLRNALPDNQPYFTSAQTDGSRWSPLPSPAMAHGAVSFAYDADQHVVYSANTTSGLWRMVTQ
jgi:hypothetical protein